jgi:hypothetical protein
VFFRAVPARCGVSDEASIRVGGWWIKEKIGAGAEPKNRFHGLSSLLVDFTLNQTMCCFLGIKLTTFVGKPGGKRSIRVAVCH